MTKLSIIIPYYNTQIYTDELMNIINNQITNEVEVILIDDGSVSEYKSNYKWLNIIRKENGGVSSARNVGLDNVSGEYVTYIDSDDLISDNYIQTILNKIKKEKFDYCYLSWESFGDWNNKYILSSVDDKFPSWNLCCWNRIYKRELIKDIKFNENKKIAEDAEYIREAEKVCKKKSIISEILYKYRSNTPHSLTKRFNSGDLDMDRIIYYFNHIDKSKSYLIDEIKEENKNSEIVILTNKNDIPELENYAMIIKPQYIKGTELRGEETNYFEKINKPIKSQIIVYMGEAFRIGGIEAFIYYFCMNMKDDYDIVVLYDVMAPEQISRLKNHVRVIKNNNDLKFLTDIALVNRITDEVPKNVIYNRKIQMIHACKLSEWWVIKYPADKYICVSNAVKDSYPVDLYGKDCDVISNFTYPENIKPALRLITASRLTYEKGEQRIIKMAKELNKLGIPFIWLLFSEKKLDEEIPGVIYMNTRLDIKPFMMSSDYLVQLSDSEAFCYSIVEALELGVPVITTPLPVLKEINFKNTVNGYEVPFDMENIDYYKIYNNIPKFKYSNDNETVKKKWKDLLGEPQPFKTYIYNKDEIVEIKITDSYYSTKIQREVKRGERFKVTRERAELIQSYGKCKIM